MHINVESDVFCEWVYGSHEFLCTHSVLDVDQIWKKRNGRFAQKFIIIAEDFQSAMDVVGLQTYLIRGIEASAGYVEMFIEFFEFFIINIERLK